MLRTAANQMLEFDQNVPTSLLPPLQAYYYIPDAESLLRGEGKKAQRSIYEGATIYSQFEEQQLQTFEERLRAINMKLPDYFSRASLLRWLQGVNYNVQKCIKALEEHFAWTKANIPKEVTSKIYQTLVSGNNIRKRECFTSMDETINSDHVQSGMRDQLKLLQERSEQQSVEDIMEGVIYVLDYVKRNLFIPGQIENWLSVMDCSKLSASSFPRKRMQPTIHALQNNFRARQFHIFSLNVSAGIRFLYAIVSPFLEKAVKKKLTMVGGMKTNKLIKLFNPCQLEQRFGGSAPNATNFWPPIIMPDGPCMTQETMLVTKEQHQSILRQDRRWVRPPVTRERYQDIYKPLEQRLAEGEDLVLPDSMERPQELIKENPDPIVEDSKEESEENEQKEGSQRKDSSDEEDEQEANVDYESARKQVLFKSITIRSLIQTRIENNEQSKLLSNQSDILRSSFFRKPESCKPSCLEKRETILMGEEFDDSDPEIDQQDAHGIEERLENSVDEEQVAHCSAIDLNEMKESSRQELIEFKDVIPQIEVLGANVSGNSHSSTPNQYSGHEPTQISTPKPLAMNFQKYLEERKPGPFIKPASKKKSAKCCEIF